MAAELRKGRFMQWVRTGRIMSPYDLVDPRPFTNVDEHGHLWLFDGGGSDLDAPYTCGLCGEPQWRAYREACAEAGRLAELNASRSKYIDDHAVSPVMFVPDGEPYGQTLARLEVAA